LRNANRDGNGDGITGTELRALIIIIIIIIIIS
jgi:hypothetical protein